MCYAARSEGEVRSIRPRFANAWANRGVLWRAKGDLRRAEEDLSHAIESEPQLADAYAHRGLARMLQGKEADAQRDFEQCLALNKNLRQSLERLIADTKQRMAGRNPTR
jgi:tetratricopeptide (TPR) repeat protein